MAYVNYLGQTIGLVDHGTAPKPKAQPEPFHKGWRVMGVPPGALEEARSQAKRLKERFDQDAWLMRAKPKAVRSKAYVVRLAADECATLATKAGWLRVEVVEQKRGEVPKKAAFMPRRTA